MRQRPLVQIALSQQCAHCSRACALLPPQDLPFKETKLPPLSPQRQGSRFTGGVLSPSSKSGCATLCMLCVPFALWVLR